MDAEKTHNVNLKLPLDVFQALKDEAIKEDRKVTPHLVRILKQYVNKK